MQEEEYEFEGKKIVVFQLGHNDWGARFVDLQKHYHFGDTRAEAIGYAVLALIVPQLPTGG
jgi:hypothetical protein